MSHVKEMHEAGHEIHDHTLFHDAAFWGNPNKADQTSLDIITTTSFSNAGTADTVTDFLDAVTGDDGAGNLKGKTYSDLLRDLDNNSFWFHTMYGVHGIDDNPTADPLADHDQLCSSCSSDSDCGFNGSCVDLGGGGICTFECTADAGCPGDSICQVSEASGWLRDSYCVPADLVCQ